MPIRDADLVMRLAPVAHATRGCAIHPGPIEMRPDDCVVTASRAAYLMTPMTPVTVPTTPLTVPNFAAAPVQMPYVFCRQPRDHHSCPNFAHLCCRR
jgi:hypothetical protein